MHLTKWLLLAALAATTAAAPKLPPNLAGYRSWTALDERPRLMPLELSMACGPMRTQEEIAEIKKKAGPHADVWTMVYLNPAALDALKVKGGEFPAGAMIAKEKRRNPDDAPEAVAFMIKHPKGKLRESGGWEFVYYPAEKNASLQRCVNCHRNGGEKDYVFSTY